MAARIQRRVFRFRFGQRVRVKQPHADSGATGRIINGRIYADGREMYSVDIPGGEWTYNSSELETADEPGR